LEQATTPRHGYTDSSIGGISAPTPWWISPNGGCSTEVGNISIASINRKANSSDRFDLNSSVNMDNIPDTTGEVCITSVNPSTNQGKMNPFKVAKAIDALCVVMQKKCFFSSKKLFFF
jgi:hypothetical protein